MKDSTLTYIIIGLMLLALVLTSCVPQERYEKPFVIVRKITRSQESTEYWYQTKSGAINNFYDSSSKYNVGDTIK